jgi:hypothetical protein
MVVSVALISPAKLRYFSETQTEADIDSGDYSLYL